MSDPTLSDIDFKNKMAWVWATQVLDQLVKDVIWIYNCSHHILNGHI